MKNYLAKTKRKILAVTFLLCTTLVVLLLYLLFFSSLNSKRKEFSIYVPTYHNTADIEKVILDSLYSGAKYPSLVYYKWKITAWLKSSEPLQPGRYKINANQSARVVLNKIKNGEQDPISVRVDNIKTIYQLAQRYDKKFEQDSSSFMIYVLENINALAPNTNSLALEVRLQSALQRILGDTYEMYWTASPENFFSQLNDMYDKNWTNEQDWLASRIGLSEHEVYVLASIVRGETADKNEAPQVAGLYLNRLKQGMLLQSDPTVLFGINTKEKRQRVRHSDLKYDSPYNTYLYKGLPPATIHVVEKSYLTAVLNATTHDYIFMCAQPKGTGKHNFAVTYTEHQANARKFQAYLDSINIQR